MDNAQKAIMIGVGLFITIIIISAVMLITSAGQDMVNDSMGKLDNISAQLSASEWSSFDNQYMNGSQVITYIKKYYKSTDLVCYYQSTNGTVVTASNLAAQKVPTISGKKVSDQEYVTEVVVSEPEDLTSLSKLTATTEVKTYVSATAKYYAQLIKTTEGDNVGICFVKQ